jgi:hypothetical protein
MNAIKTGWLRGGVGFFIAHVLSRELRRDLCNTPPLDGNHRYSWLPPRSGLSADRVLMRMCKKVRP